MAVDLEGLRRIALGLPGVTEGTAYGTPAFRVAKRFLGRLREDGETLALKMDMDARDHLIEMEPETFFITDHYRGYPYVLIRLPRIDEPRLRLLFTEAWRAAAPRRLLARHPG